MASPLADLIACSELCDLLVDHLSIGDVFRLRRAVGREFVLSPYALATLAARMSLSTHRTYTLEALSTKMFHTRRCVECGTPTGCVPRACYACISIEWSPVAMLTRAQIRDLCRARRRPYLTVLHACVPVRRDRVGRFFYWKRDVESAAAHVAHTRTR